MKKVDAWECEFCTKQGERHVISKHEDECIRNPEFKACSTCAHELVEWWDGNPCFSCLIKCEHSDHDIDGGCKKHELK